MWHAIVRGYYYHLRRWPRGLFLVLGTLPHKRRYGRFPEIALERRVKVTIVDEIPLADNDREDFDNILPKVSRNGKSGD